MPPLARLAAATPAPSSACGPPLERGAGRGEEAAAGVQPRPRAHGKRNRHRGHRTPKRLPRGTDQRHEPLCPPARGPGLPPAAALGDTHAGQTQRRRPRQQPRRKPRVGHAFEKHSALERHQRRPQVESAQAVEGRARSAARLGGGVGGVRVGERRGAGPALELKKGGVSNCCLGKTKRAGGYEFKWAPLAEDQHDRPGEEWRDVAV
eukprot:scaffold51102_cov57-Phaeocystis_antarctica.AAC.2